MTLFHGEQVCVLAITQVILVRIICMQVELCYCEVKCAKSLVFWLEYISKNTPSVKLKQGTNNLAMPKNYKYEQV